MEWLYWYLTLGYEPQSDMLTGPTVIDASTVDGWIERIRAVFGEEYDKQTQGVWD
jgi:simple sugar transport system substrate-binding protein